jgi:hypothetical protein
MARTTLRQARQHSLILDDDVWVNLILHAAKRGESASGFTNTVLQDVLGMLPGNGPAREYVPGDIFASGSVDPARELLKLASADYSLEAKLGSIGFKQTVHPGDPYEDIDLSPVPEHGLVSESEVPEDGAEF